MIDNCLKVVVKGKLLFVGLCISLFLFGIVGFIAVFSEGVSAQTMNTVNFQGKIVQDDGLNVSSSETSCIAAGADTCGFQVVYYDASSGGNTLGTETFTNVEIGDYDGVVNLALGTGSYSAGTESSFVNIFRNNSTTYAEVKFDHDGNASYTEVFGRMAVRGAAYAVRADTADSINGMDEGDFVQFAPSSKQTDTSTVSSIFIDKTGASGNIIELEKNGSDVMVLNNNGGLSLGNDASIAGLTVGKGGAGLTYSTILGVSALVNTAGDYNTAVGYQALATNVGNTQSTAVGYQAMRYADNRAVGQVTGNTAVGYLALRGSTSASANTGQYNTAIGSNTLFSLSSGGSNTGIGSSVLSQTTTGSYNIGIGTSVMGSNTTGGNNIALGYVALTSNVGNSRSIAIGPYAMERSDDRVTGRSTYNIALGYTALRGSSTAANNTGQYNIAIGDTAMTAITSGNGNVAFGTNALDSLTSGTGNIALGYYAGENITTGGSNILIGYDIDAPSATADSQLSIGNLIFATGGFGTGTSLGAGNVGIGDASPSAKFVVGNGDLFQVNSTGAIAAATGITSSGTITFSGLSDGVVSVTSGVLSGGGSFDNYGSWTYQIDTVSQDAVSSGNTLNFSAGNDLDIADTGTRSMTFNIESTLNYVSTITGASSDLTLSTTTSGDLILDPIDNVSLRASIIPDADDTYDIGSSTYRIQDLYVGNSSIHVGTSSAEGTLSYATATGLTLTNSAATTSGNSGITLTSGATTGTGIGISANAVTSGTGFRLDADALTTGTGVILSSGSTQGAAIDNSSVLKIIRSGANANAGHTAYGLNAVISNTGSSSINYAGYFEAINGGTNIGVKTEVRDGLYNYGGNFSASTSGSSSATGGSFSASVTSGSTGSEAIGGYFNASGANVNYAAIFDNGNVEIRGVTYIGDTATSTNDLYIADRITDWDNSAYYVDPNGTTIVNNLTVNGTLSGIPDVYVYNSGDTMTGDLTMTNGEFIYFEDGKHSITNNDGKGNFNIRVGNSIAEVITEDGYAFHQEYTQGSGTFQINISQNGGLGDPVTWNDTMQFSAGGNLDINGNFYAAGGISTYDTTVTDNYIEAGGFCMGNGTNCISSWYSAGNDLDLSGTTFNIESTLNYVSTITRSSGNITISATSGSVYLTPSSSGLVYADGLTVGKGPGGNLNTVLGTNALSTNDGNYGSTAIGYGAMYYADNRATGRHTGNTAVGYYALLGSGTAANNYGQYNTAIGQYSLLDNSSGYYNTALGSSALANVSSGSNNIGIGYNAGDNITTGSTNIMIGYDINAQSATTSNQLSIGNLIMGAGGFGTGTTVGTGYVGIATLPSASYKLKVGGAGHFTGGLTSDGYITANSDNSTQYVRIQNYFTSGTYVEIATVDGYRGIATTASSIKYKTNIEDMTLDSSLIYQMRPVSFNWKSNPDGEKTFGFIAEEVEPLIPELIMYRENGEILSVNYTLIPVLNLAELQKHEARLDEIESAIGGLVNTDASNIILNMTGYIGGLETLSASTLQGLSSSITDPDGNPYEQVSGFDTVMARNLKSALIQSENAIFGTQITNRMKIAQELLVTGNVSVTGDILINGVTISSLDGLVDIEGDLSVNKLIADTIKVNRGDQNGDAAGVAEIPADTTTLMVETQYVKSDSVVIAVPRALSDGQIPTVATKNITDGSFELLLEGLASETVYVDWLIIQ